MEYFLNQRYLILPLYTYQSTLSSDMHSSNGVLPPVMMDSAILGIDIRYSVSSISFQSASPIKTAFFPLLFVIVIGSQVVFHLKSTDRYSLLLL